MKVDVILPVYNGSRWIDETIQSVFDQTYDDWLLTVIDDVSTDNTVEIVDRWRDRYPLRVNLIRLKKNHRAAGARMVAVGQTDGEVIAFIDQDDIWLPEKLAMQVERFRGQPEVHAVHTDINHMNENGDDIPGSASRENAVRKATAYDRMNANELTHSLFASNTIRLVSAAVLRDPFLRSGGFDAALFGGEDWEFWVRFSRDWKIGHIDTPLVRRRIHLKNTSRSYNRERGLGLLKALDKVIGEYPIVQRHIQERRIGLLHRVIMADLQHSDAVQAKEHARALVATNPGYKQGWILWFLAQIGAPGYWAIKCYRGIKYRFE